CPPFSSRPRWHLQWRSMLAWRTCCILESVRCCRGKMGTTIRCRSAKASKPHLHARHGYERVESQSGFVLPGLRAPVRATVTREVPEQILLLGSLFVVL